MRSRYGVEYRLDPKLPEGAWKADGKKQKRPFGRETLEEAMERGVTEFRIAADLHEDLQAILQEGIPPRPPLYAA